MADNEVIPTAAPEGVSAEVHQQMQMSLSGHMPQEQVAAPAQTEGAPANQGAASPEGEQVVDINEFLKNEFGFENLDLAKTAFKEYGELKSKPLFVEPKYENEISEKLAKALHAGKTEEVYNYLNQQVQLDRLTAAEVTDDTADEIIKLSMRLKYSEEGLSEREIEYKFKKQYALPKEPQGDAEDDDFKELHAAWKEQVEDIKMSKIIDGKVAKRELAAQKQKLVLPEIQNTQSVDSNYLQYQKQLEDIEKEDTETIEFFKNYTAKQLETKMAFIDEPNKINFEFQFEPDAESFKQAIELATDSTKYYARYRNQDGTLNRKLYVEDMNFILNKDKMLMEAIKQGKNAAIKANLPDNSQGSGMNRQQIQQAGEPSELDKQMQNALGKYMPGGRMQTQN